MSCVADSPAPLYIYVLKLTEGKYYVGKSHQHITLRLDEHMSGVGGNTWTQTFTPLEVADIKVGDDYDEDKYVFKFMEQHGIGNVRGGSYSNVTLSFDQHLQAWRSIQNACGNCLACGQKGHSIPECKTPICFKCGNPQHALKDCTALVHSLGGRIDGCYRCGRPDHWAIRCNRSKDMMGRPLSPSSCVIS